MSRPFDILIPESAGWEELRAYPKSPADGDGQPARVLVFAAPARFYRVEADAAPNSVGEMQPGFVLQTGSGAEMEQLAHTIARAVAEGMIGLHEPTEQAKC